MPDAAGTLLERMLHHRAVSRWQRQADLAPTTRADRVERARLRAIDLRGGIDRFLQQAETRLDPAALPPGADQFPLGTDWVFRPDLWSTPLPQQGLTSVATATVFGPEARLFHDCPLREIGLTQRRNRAKDGLPPWAVEVEVFGFTGKFLSLALDLPETATLGMQLRHLIRLETRVETERPLGLFARLNIRHGPNVARIVRQVPQATGRQAIAFDLATSEIDVRRITKLWVDLVLEAPEMNRITFRDVVLCRHPRAEL
jgi:hypothetical protein